MKATIALAFLFAVLSASALEIVKRFTTPLVSYSPDINQSAKDSVKVLLKYMNEDLTFIEGGRAPQLEQVQRFGGSAAQTSHFIGMLKDAGLWEIEVRFRDFGEQESAFLLIEESGPSQLAVEVNLRRDDFSLKHFSEFQSQAE